MDKQYWYSVGRQAWHEFRYWGGKALFRLMQTPLPKLFVICMAIALFCVLLPLTITLFITFLLIKVGLGLLAYAARANRGKPSQLHRDYK